MLACLIDLRKETVLDAYHLAKEALKCKHSIQVKRDTQRPFHVLPVTCSKLNAPRTAQEASGHRNNDV